MVKRGIIVFGVAFLIRAWFSVFVFMEPERSFGFGADSYCYNDLAKSMIEYHGFSVYPEEAYLPEPARTPGYPFLLGIIYKIFGERQEIVVLF